MDAIWRDRGMNSVGMRIMNVLHDGKPVSRREIINELKDNGPIDGIEFGIDNLHIRGFIQSVGYEVYSISEEGLKVFNDQMLRDG